MSKDKLTFGDLSNGEYFITFPLAGDDSGHGGYKGEHYLFKKKNKREAVRVLDKTLNEKIATSTIPASMWIIKVG